MNTHLLEDKNRTADKMFVVLTKTPFLWVIILTQKNKGEREIVTTA